MRLALALLAVGVLLPAQTRSRKAHEHGSAKVNIAFESAKGAPKGVVEFESPADSVVGFEYEAKTAADKAKVTAALNTLKARFGEMVIFPAAAACAMTNKSAKVEADDHHDAKSKGARQEQHSEVHAGFEVACAKPLSGLEIRFGFMKVFPKIHDVNVALLIGDQQLSADVENDKGVLKIAK
ncbi:MAG: DUF2796 domain-containing protein [Acidobacteria bacterium]|nr:DUF2796 domain-containing protein [Acidobacteriota bacterium]